MRAFDAACNVPWAIRPEALRMILQIADRQHEADLATAAQRLAARFDEINLGAVSVSPGKPLAGTHTVRVRGSTAVVPIEGPIFRYANLFSSMSGATSIEALARDLNVALRDPDIEAILLHVDSPGGEVNGTAEFAELVHQAAKTKNVVAYVSNEGASAAYWIASAARRIVVANTALVGSIGVCAAMPTGEKADRVEFVSSQSPRKRPDLASKDGQGQVQTIVDDLAEEFIGAVARYRGVSRDTVASKFGQGDVMVGAKAVEAGLADEVGSFESVLQLLARPEEASAYSTSTRAASPPASVSAEATSVEDGEFSAPMPTPSKGEPENDFVSRCMGDSTMRKEYPRQDQRSAVCHRQWDGKKAEASEGETSPEPASESSPISGGAAASTTGDVDMTGWRDRLLAAVQAIPAQDEGEAPAAAAEAVRPAMPAEPDEVINLRAQVRARDDELARQRAANQRLTAERIAERGSAFADKIITVDHKAFPSQREQIIALYVQAATDDSVVPLEGSTRVDMLARSYDAAPKHLLDEETIPSALHHLQALANVVSTPAATDAGKDISEERRQHLLSLTAAGREVLAQHKNGRN